MIDKNQLIEALKSCKYAVRSSYNNHPEEYSGTRVYDPCEWTREDYSHNPYDDVMRNNYKYLTN